MIRLALERGQALVLADWLEALVAVAMKVDLRGDAATISDIAKTIRARIR